MDFQYLISSIDDQQQRDFIKFGLLLGKNASQIRRELHQAIGSRAYSVRTVQEWIQRFKDGRTETKDMPRSGHPTNVRTEERKRKLEKELDEDDSQSQRELASKLECSQKSVRRMIKQDLDYVKLLSDSVPHVLTEDQKEMRWHISEVNLLKHRSRNGWLRKIVALDESWVQFYRALPRHKRAHWVKRRQKPAKEPATEPYGTKALLVVGMDWNGIAFWELFDEEVTMTSAIYIDFLDRNVTKWQMDNNINRPHLLHDNATSHKARIVREFIQSKNWSLVPHPPYSPDLNPCDFNCFGNLKMRLAGTRYKDWNSLNQAVDQAIRDLNESGSFNGVQKLPEIWEAVIEHEGNYVCTTYTNINYI